MIPPGDGEGEKGSPCQSPKGEEAIDLSPTVSAAVPRKPTADAAPFTVPWDLRDVAWAMVIFGFIFGSFAVALAILRVIQKTINLNESTYVHGILLLILESALIFPVWLYTIRKYRVSWETLGFRPFRWANGLGWVALLLMISFIVNALWASLLARYNLQVQPDILPIFGKGVIGLSIAWLAAGVAAPLVEETFFRGFLLPALLQRFRFSVAAVLDGLIFALIHFTPTAIVPLFFLGVFLSILYRVTRSIWPCIIMHAAMNTLAVFAAYAVETGIIPMPGS